MAPHIRRQLIVWSGLYGLFLLIGTVYLYNNLSLHSNPFVTQSASAAEKILLDENTKILSYSNSYKSSGNKDLVKLEQLKFEAKQRKDKLIQLLNNDPNAVRNNLFNTQEINSFPPEIQSDIEKPVTLVGKSITYHADNFNTGDSEDITYIEADSTKYRLYNLPKQELPSQSTVAVSGMAIGTVLVANGSTDSVGVVKTASIPKALGQKKLAIIQFNFQDDTSVALPMADLKNEVFASYAGTVNADLKESSFSQISLVGNVHPDGDTYGPYTIPFNKSAGCQEANWKPSIDQKAAVDGFSSASYDYVIYNFPFIGDSLCPHTSLAELGGKASWINGNQQVKVLVHELGHNFGLLHAHTTRCQVNGQTVAISKVGNCTISEYGDAIDVMGSGKNQYGGFNKDQVGWLPSSRIQYVTAAGVTTKTIVPLEKSSGVNLIYIPFTEDFTLRAYTIEYRQPSGVVDAFAPSDPVVNGLTLKKVYDMGPIYGTDLIDTTPNSSAFGDAYLTPGSQFFDPDNNIRVKTISIGSSSATVEITLGSGTPTPTQPTGTPISGSITHQQTVNGGSSNSITVSSASITGVSGNVYVTSVSTRPNITVTSLSGLGLTWTKVVAQCAGRAQTRVEVWKGTGTPSTGTVTATLSSAATNAVIAVSRYSGATGVVDPFGQNTLGVNGACSGGTDTNSYSFSIPTSNSKLLYAATALRNRTFTPGSGFTERTEKAQGSSGEIAGVEVMDTSYSSAANTAVSGTLSGTVDWAVGVVELIP